MLGAVLLAFAAAHALAGAGPLAPQAGGAQILAFGVAALGGGAVVAGEHARNIHPGRAGLAVAAAGAAHPHGGLQVRPQPLHKGVLLFGHAAGPGRVGLGGVVPHHLQAVHAGQHHRHPRLVPQPAQPPAGGGPAALGHPLLGRRRQAGDQPSAPQRFHDDDRDALGRGGLQSPAAGLGVLVQIVVLDLAEVPVVGVQQLQKGRRVPVEGKPDPPDGAGGLLLGDPLPDAQAAQLLPGGQVGEHVHQVKVDAVGAQAGQLLGKAAVDARPGLDQVLGQLVGNVDLVPAAQATQRLAQGGLAAAVDVGGVKVVDAQAHRLADLRGDGVLVNAPAGFGKPQAAVSQRRKLCAGFVRTILHGDVLLCCAGDSPQGSSYP